MGKIFAVFVSVRLIVKVVLKFKRHKLITISKQYLITSSSFAQLSTYRFIYFPHAPPFFRIFFGIPPWFLLFLPCVFHSSLDGSSNIFRFLPYLIYYSAKLCYLRAFAPRILPFHPSRSMLGMDNPQSEFVIDIAAGESENR